MLFTSVTFLFIFLPLVLCIYYLLPQKLHNGFLLLASIIFYALGEPKYLFVMFGIIVINYFGALLITQKEKQAKFWLTLTLIANISTLIYFKYFNFIIDNLNQALQTNFSFWNVALPLGISFYTFQAISYSVDVYRKLVKPQKSIYKLALYISLFPQLIAGPIVKYHNLEGQIDNRHTSFDEFYNGLRRLIIGIAKKVLIADVLGGIANNIFELAPTDFGTGIAWFGAIIFALQFYFDFSSYADIAIGLGHLFGFTITENFNYPYVAKSMSETWRRWHISLATWFKDYLYIPLGGSKKGFLRKNVNIMIVFFLMGAWHGAAWTYIASGIYNGCLLVFENITKIYKDKPGFFYNLFKRIYTLIAIILGVLFFRTQTLAYSKDYILNMFGLLKTNNTAYNIFNYIDRFEIIVIIIAILCAGSVFKNMLKWGEKNEFIRILTDIWLFILLMLSCMQIAASTYNPFIYFRF